MPVWIELEYKGSDWNYRNVCDAVRIRIAFHDFGSNTNFWHVNDYVIVLWISWRGINIRKSFVKLKGFDQPSATIVVGIYRMYRKKSNPFHRHFYQPFKKKNATTFGLSRRCFLTSPYKMNKWPKLVWDTVCVFFF